MFLSFILPSIDQFNRVFQKSTENTTCQLYDEMSRLVQLYASNVLSKDSIVAVGDNLQRLNFESINQLPDENLGVGESTWTCLHNLEQEYDLKSFFDAVRSFYISNIKKMLAKLPFEDTLLKNLGAHTIIGLAKRFPQLELADSASLDHLGKSLLISLCLHLTYQLQVSTMLLMAQSNPELAFFDQK